MTTEFPPQVSVQGIPHHMNANCRKSTDTTLFDHINTMYSYYQLNSQLKATNKFKKKNGRQKEPNERH